MAGRDPFVRRQPAHGVTAQHPQFDRSVGMDAGDSSGQHRTHLQGHGQGVFFAGHRQLDGPAQVTPHGPSTSGAPGTVHGTGAPRGRRHISDLAQGIQGRPDIRAELGRAGSEGGHIKQHRRQQGGIPPGEIDWIVVPPAGFAPARGACGGMALAA